MMPAKRRARVCIRGNDSAHINAAVLGLMRAVENLFRTERRLGPCCYRQEPAVRMVALNAMERLRECLNEQGGAE